MKEKRIWRWLGLAGVDYLNKLCGMHIRFDWNRFVDLKIGRILLAELGEVEGCRLLGNVWCLLWFGCRAGKTGLSKGYDNLKFFNSKL
jgi:hypothetical protein